MVRRNDSAAKYKMKQAADKKNRASEKNIKEGDRVMMKNDFRSNKLQSTYKPRLETVVATKGPMVTMSGNVTRNVSRFKKVKGVVNLIPKEVVEEMQWPQHQLGENPNPARQPGLNEKGAMPRVDQGWTYE